MNLVVTFVFVTAICTVGCSDGANPPFPNAKLSNTMNDLLSTLTFAI